MLPNWKPQVDVIIPTFNNTQYLIRTVQTLLAGTSTALRVWIINNGGVETEWSLDKEGKIPLLGVNTITLPENRGWMGGVNAGLEASKDGACPYVLFLNDDVRIIDGHHGWLSQMINVLAGEPSVGAGGPASNNVLWNQNIARTNEIRSIMEVPVLSGFCLLLRRSLVDQIGGLDESLFGGDDLDYAIRIKDAGFRNVCYRGSFVYHYGQITGRRLHPDWDDQEWADKISIGLIRKHGLMKWLTGVNAPLNQKWAVHNDCDLEATVLLHKVGKMEDKVVLDLGCGSNKILPHFIGVDMVPEGEYGMSANMRYKPVSGVDVQADVSKPLPFPDGYADFIIAKHILEHIYDFLSALKNWHKVLKPDGRLWIGLPDPALCEAMQVDATHVHAFNRESLVTALEMTDYEIEEIYGIEGANSICVLAKKVERDAWGFRRVK